MVTPGSPMIDRSPRCYIPSFLEISRPVREKIFEGFLPYMGVAAMWSCIMSCQQIFISLNLKDFIQNCQNGTVVSEKIRFGFLYVHDLGPRSRNDPGLQFSHINPLFSLFPIEKPKFQNLTLP